VENPRKIAESRHTYIEPHARQKMEPFGWMRTWLLATAKKSLQWPVPKHSFPTGKLTMSSWELGRRNDKFSGKHETGGLKTQPSEAFTGHCIQIPQSPDSMLETSPPF
jgi:hypothetical protein